MSIGSLLKILLFSNIWVPRCVELVSLRSLGLCCEDLVSSKFVELGILECGESGAWKGGELGTGIL